MVDRSAAPSISDACCCCAGGWLAMKTSAMADNLRFCLYPATDVGGLDNSRAANGEAIGKLSFKSSARILMD